jgi:hypothetical protein
MIIFTLLNCGSEDYCLKNSKWVNKNGKSIMAIDSSLNAKITFDNSKGYERKLLFEFASADSFIYNSHYKDSMVNGGYLKLINNDEAILCNLKTLPTRSGNIDGFTYFKKEGRSNTQSNITKIIFPKKYQGRYVLEFTDECINNTKSENKLYEFENKHLIVESKLYPLEIAGNKYEFYFRDSNIEIPQFSNKMNNDSIAQINPDSIFVWRLGMNYFSHYKIYQYDSLNVKKDAEYFFAGKLSKILNHEIYDQY